MYIPIFLPLCLFACLISSVTYSRNLSVGASLSFSRALRCPVYKLPLVLVCFLSSLYVWCVLLVGSRGTSGGGAQYWCYFGDFPLCFELALWLFQRVFCNGILGSFTLAHPIVYLLVCLHVVFTYVHMHVLAHAPDACVHAADTNMHTCIFT